MVLYVPHIWSKLRLEYVGNELSRKRRKNKNLLELQKKYHDARMEQDKELYERQIKIVDAQIDKMEYGLYGLTDEEIGIIEESLQIAWLLM